MLELTAVSFALGEVRRLVKASTTLGPRLPIASDAAFGSVH
ncbi:hypothetical protein ACVWZK_004086 [Bradyrhizobium sp. GM0.4]